MGLAYEFHARFTGKGSSVINALLMSWQHTDVSGEQTDQVMITVAAPDLDSLPDEDEQIGFSWGPSVNGQPALVDKGKFIITRITPSLWPHRVTIIATAARFQVADQTGFKLRRSQTWENTTVGKIFRELVNRHGLSPRIAADLDNISIDHIDQNDETDMAFLTRIARKYDAVAKPVDDLYIMARRGQVKSISGKTLTPVVFSLPKNNVPTSSNFVNASIDFPSRSRFKGVWAMWLNQASGEEIKVSVGEAPFKRLPQKFESELLAKQQCESVLRKAWRTANAIRLDVPANPYLVAEGIITLDGSFPAYMAGDWSIDKVITTSNAKSGARSMLYATRPDG
jgi:hypothetical protein